MRPSRPKLAAAALAAALLPAAAEAQVVISDPSFVADTIHQGNGMISIEFGPNGKMYVAEKQGRVLHFAPDGSGGFNAPSVLADLRNAVDASQESGLLGMAVDPDIANNHFIYLFYTTANDQRLVRIEVNAAFDQMVAGSETILISGFPRTVNFHKAGDIQFKPNEPNHLYVAIGDDSRATLAQDTSEYHGKLLRVSKADGAGLLDNPFQNGNTNSIESRIWSIGLRNPFRFVFHPNLPNPDVIYLSENGNSTDRVSWMLRGSNGAWNQAGDNGGFLNPPDANHKVMTTDSPFVVGIAVNRGGPFADPANPNSDTIFVSNGNARNVRRWRLSGANLDTLNTIAADNGNPFITNAIAMDLTFGPDGALYMTNTQGGESTGNTYFLRRIRYIAGAPPVASFTTTPSPARGNVPLQISFNDTSTDPDGTIQSWLWNFGDGQTSTQQNPTYTYQAPGTYRATLTVTDDTGLPNTAQVTVNAERLTTLSFSGQIYDGRNGQLTNLGIASQLRLYRGDATTPIAFTGGVGPQQNGIAVGAGGAISASIQVALTEAEVVVSAGEGTAARTAYHGFVVPMAQTSWSAALTYVLSDTAIRGRIRDTRGIAAIADFGVSRGMLGNLYPFAGGRDYLTGVGLPATGVLHRAVSDELGFYYIPIATADGGSRFYVDVVADTNNTVYLPAAFDVTVNTNSAVDRDVTLGLQIGGASCDDLAMVPETENVDYATMIQPIWDLSCTGCHSAGSGNNGGLNLQENSYANLLGAMSIEVPGRRLVEPGDVARSFLYEKINCANPQVGTRMRPTDPMRFEEQALIKDWIAQGALEMPGVPIPDAGLPPQEDATVQVDTGIPTTDPMDAGVIIPDRDSGMEVPGVDASTPPSQRPDKSALRGACACSATHENGDESNRWSLAAICVLISCCVLRKRR